MVDGSGSVDQSVLTGESAGMEVALGGSCYTGSVVRRDEATGEVTATGERTYFGRAAQLARTAKTASHLEETVFRVVWALLVLDGALVVAIIAYGLVAHLPADELLPFVLILVVATVPVALPATFALATSVGALELTLAAAASDEATQDPIDLAVLAAAAGGAGGAGGLMSTWARRRFVPFGPATQRSEALVEQSGKELRVVKGTPAVVASLVGAVDRVAFSTRPDRWKVPALAVVALLVATVTLDAVEVPLLTRMRSDTGASLNLR